MSVMTSIKFLYGDVECLHMPLENVEELFGPFGANGISLKDHRFRVNLNKDAEDYEFDGDDNDWRLTLLEISLTQQMAEMREEITRHLEVINTHVKRIRCDLETILDPQRGGISDDSKQ
jgi:hypothetical protein